jgi:subtilase family serine protease
LIRRNILNYRLSIAVAVAASFVLPAAAVADETLVPVKASPDFSRLRPSIKKLDTSKVIQFGFGLTGFQKDQADAFVASQSDPNSPNFHQWIPVSTFGARFGAPASDVKAVSDYLNKEGFTNVHASAGGIYITASGTIDQASRAFGTEFANFERPAKFVARGEPELFYGPKTPIKLPGELVPLVAGAYGFDNAVYSHPGLKTSKMKKAKGKSTTDGGYTPAQIAQAYGSAATEKTLSSLKTYPSPNKIAIYSPTYRYLDDPATFATQFNLGSNFTVYDLFVDGGPSDGNGAGEASLDVETIIGQAPDSTVFFVSPAEDSLQSELDAYEAVGIVGDIPVLTSSWGIDEYELIQDVGQSDASAFATAFAGVCEELCAAGVSIFNDSGDWGAYDPAGTGKVSTQVETSCPYLTAVGGSQLYTNSNGSYNKETLWLFTGSSTSKPSGGGGGLSQFIKLPSWQVGPGVKNKYSNGFRQVPDVVSNSSGNSPYAIVIGGTWNQVWGTSAATPLWAVNTLLAEQIYSNQLKENVFLGFLNPAIYTLGNWFENPATWISGEQYNFHDITVGNDGVYPTAVGYDIASGWGSVDFGKNLEDLGYYFKIPGYSPDYVPFTPATPWKFPVMIHATTSTVSEPSSFVHGTKYYMGVSSANQGTGGTTNADGPSAPFEIEVNGAVVLSGTFPALASGKSYSLPNSYSYTFPSAGTYTVKLLVNTGKTPLYEHTTTNNTYTRTITVK